MGLILLDDGVLVHVQLEAKPDRKEVRKAHQLWTGRPGYSLHCEFLGPGNGVSSSF